MDWLSTFAVVALVAGTVCVAVMTVVAYDLRRHLHRRLDEIADRQAQHARRIADGIEALRRDQAEAEGRLGALTRSQRQLSVELAEIRERLGDGTGTGGASGDRILH
ncbi:hypothetical protein [Arenibaculum sp.]|uniref:hypothetical protein n=1 Tax=Arenibaculum sp. TaxID=2865862 RepID=UPI002E11A308|nr:hypothetical protein [Arenibaculum sp.]